MVDNIIVFGHSVTQGFWDEKGGWVQRLRTFLDTRALRTQDEEDVFYTFNAGISGDTTEDLLERFEDEYRRRGDSEEYEELLLIQIGTNDAITEDGERKVSEERFRENIRKILSKGEKLADRFIMVGDFPVDPEMEKIPYAPEQVLRNEDVRRYDRIKKEICHETGIEFIDLFKLMEDREVMEFLEEGVHPNSEGHRVIHRGVKETLEEKNLI